MVHIVVENTFEMFLLQKPDDTDSGMSPHSGQFEEDDEEYLPQTLSFQEVKEVKLYFRAAFSAYCATSL